MRKFTKMFIGMWLGVLFTWSVPSHAEDLIQMRNSVVEIETGDALGTGVVLNDHTVLTANHVIERANFITVTFFGSTFALKATVVKTDKDKDLALLTIPVPKGIPKATVECQEVVYGEPLVMIGFPLGMPWVLSRGFVASQYLGGAKDGGQTLMDMRTNHGNSGGPVFNSKGQVVGIALAEVGQLPDKERGIGNTYGLFLSTSKFCKWLGL